MTSNPTRDLPSHRAPIRRLFAIGVTAAALALAFAMVDLGALAEAAGRVSFTTLLIVTSALMTSALLACVRLACIASDLGYRMRASDAIAALSLGQLGGAIFFQLAGQLIARSAVLARRGVPVAGTVLMTGYERLVALAISVALALAGGWHLFGKITLDIEAGGATFLKLMAGGALALTVSGLFAWGRSAGAFARANIGPGAAWRVARSLLLSLAIQIWTIVAYLAAVVALSPETATIDVIAAAAVVMLAASVPVSLAGWGVRELGAIYALGAIGLNRETALVVAILIGAVALAVVAILAAVAALSRTMLRTPAVAQREPKVDTRRLLAWSVPVLAAIAVFFQVHVPLSASRVNVNLADPLAVIGAALFAVDRIGIRKLPEWRLPLFNTHLAVMTALVAGAFLHGWSDFGLTAWALTNRLTGWFILLAYLATGALLVSRTGQSGFFMLLRTYAAAALGVIALELVIFAAVRLGLPVPTDIIQYRVEGFAQNPNAFALQVLFAIAAILVTIKGARAQTIALGIAFLGLWYSGSRAGFIAIALVLAAALMLRAASVPRLAGAIVLTIAAAAFMHWIPDIAVAAAEALRWVIKGAVWLGAAIIDLFYATADAVHALFRGGSDTGPARASVASAAETFWTGPALVLSPPSLSSIEIVSSGYESSNVQRIASLEGGLEMFLANPIFGAGLGAFIESYTRAHGTPLVIHSTPLWLLAELGIVGLFAFVAPFVRVLRYETYEASLADPVRTFIILALLAFAVIAAVHDIMYQRVFWLLIGAALALRARAVSAS